MKRRIREVFALCCTLTIAGNAVAAEKFGLVFDLDGTAEVRSAAGKMTRLEKNKHILFPVKEGDRLKTGASGGKMVVVSLRDKTGYELGAGSEAVVEETAVKALKGTVRTHKSLTVSSGGAGEPIGAIVLRGGSDAPVSALSPADTAVIDETPELRWELRCPAPGDVSVRVAEEGAEVLRTTASGVSYRLPAGVLKEGKRYSWTVDAGSACGKADAEFSVPQNRSGIRAELQQRKATAASLPERLSLLFFMVDGDLRQEARAELEKLQGEFPDNRFLREL